MRSARGLLSILVPLAAVMALVTILACAAEPRRGLVVYLAAFGFLASSVLGGLILQMCMHACGARWFIALQRLTESIAGVAPLAPLAFLPVAFGLHRIYPWARPTGDLSLLERESLEHAARWIAPRPFLLRSLGCFVIWLVLVELLRRASLAQDRGKNPRSGRALRVLAAGGLPVIAIVTSISIYDWLSSIVPGFSSSIYALRVLVGGFGSAVGALTIALHVARSRRLLPEQVGASHVHALGRLLLMSTCLWAYLAASELVIVWSADLPREAPYFLLRWRGAARVESVFLIVGHFVVPFLLLLSRPLKRSSLALATLGGWWCSMHALDCYWLVVPAMSARFAFIDLAPFVLLATLGVGVGWLRFRQAPALPLHAPDLARSLSYEST